MADLIADKGIHPDNAYKNKSFFSRLWKQRCLQLMLLPGIISLLVFAYVPMVGLVYSFTEFNIVKPFELGKWVGFDNFIEFFTSTDFAGVMTNTIGISVFKILVGFPLSILFAILLNELASQRFKRIVQTVSYLPYFFSWILLAGILINWLSDTGLVTQILLKAGLIKEATFFLGEPRYFWSITVITEAWKDTGYQSIIFLAAIAGIDVALYEAATIDGAGRFAKIRYVTLPSIMGTIVVMFILAVGYIMSTNFDQIYALRNSLNQTASDVIDIHILRMGITSGRFSYATAIGFFRSVLSLVMLAGANIATKKISGKSLF